MASQDHAPNTSAATPKSAAPDVLVAFPSAAKRGTVSVWVSAVEKIDPAPVAGTIIHIVGRDPIPVKTAIRKVYGILSDAGWLAPWERAAAREHSSPRQVSQPIREAE